MIFSKDKGRVTENRSLGDQGLEEEGGCDSALCDGTILYPNCGHGGGNLHT